MCVFTPLPGATQGQLTFSPECPKNYIFSITAPCTKMHIYIVPIQLSPTPYFLSGKGANLINCNIDLFSVPLLSDLNRPLLEQEGDRN